MLHGRISTRRIAKRSNAAEVPRPREVRERGRRKRGRKLMQLARLSAQGPGSRVVTRSAVKHFAVATEPALRCLFAFLPRSAAFLVRDAFRAANHTVCRRDQKAWAGPAGGRRQFLSSIAPIAKHSPPRPEP